MPTNKELEAELKEVRGENEGIKQRLIAMEEAQNAPISIDEFPTMFRDAPEGGGWVVRSPNKLFNGNTCRIRFVQGMAVIAKDTTDAEKTVKTLTGEYGYSSQPITEDDMVSFNQFITNNLAALMDGKADGMEGKLMQPVFTSEVIRQ